MCVQVKEKEVPEVPIKKFYCLKKLEPGVYPRAVAAVWLVWFQPCKNMNTKCFLPIFLMML